MFQEVIYTYIIIHSDCAHVSLAVEVKIPPEKVKEQFEKLEMKFGILFYSAFEDLKKNSSLETLKGILKVSLVDSKSKMEIDAITSFNDLGDFLRKKSSPANLTVLQEIVAKFNLRSAKQNIKKFEKSRKKFYKKIRLQDFAKLAKKQYKQDNEVQVILIIIITY